MNYYEIYPNQQNKQVTIVAKLSQPSQPGQEANKNPAEQGRTASKPKPPKRLPPVGVKGRPPREAPRLPEDGEPQVKSLISILMPGNFNRDLS